MNNTHNQARTKTAAWRLSVIAGAVGLAISMSAGLAWAQAGDEADAPVAARAKAAEPRFVRSTQSEDGSRLALQSAVRVYEPVSGRGPTITMAGAAHIGERSFYARLQEVMDAQQVVLYESVKPSGTGRPEFDIDTNADRVAVRRTHGRIDLLLHTAAIIKDKTGSYPSSIEELLEKADARYRKLLASATSDGWGRPLSYKAEFVTSSSEPPPSDKAVGTDKAIDPVPLVRITSLGSDGAPGGKRFARDIVETTQAMGPGMGSATRRGPGLQEQLATALGLVFQLTAMNHGEGPNREGKAVWRNSDLSVDQVMDRLSPPEEADVQDNAVEPEPAAGEKLAASDNTANAALEAPARPRNANALFRLLDGSSPMAKMAGFGLRLMRILPGGQSIGRVAIIEMLGRADELLDAAEGGMGGAGAMGVDPKTMKVILHDRNEVVLADLREILKNEAHLERVGIIYGAGHLPDLEKVILTELGYREKSVEWVDAITVDVRTAQLSPQTIKGVRDSVRQSLDQQIKSAERARTRKRSAE